MSRDITFEEIKNALEKATTKVDSLKHATPQAKKEVYDLLIRMRDDLIRWDEISIEIPDFMREETR